MTIDKFYRLYKDRRLAQSPTFQNYHIWLITPVACLRDYCDISESPDWCRAKVICWHGLALLISRHAMSSEIVYSTAGCCAVLNWEPQQALDVGWKLKIIGNGRKWSEVIGNGQKRSEAIGIGHVTYVDVTRSRDHPQTCRNAKIHK